MDNAPTHCRWWTPEKILDVVDTWCHRHRTMVRDYSDGDAAGLRAAAIDKLMALVELQRSRQTNLSLRAAHRAIMWAAQDYGRLTTGRDEARRASRRAWVSHGRVRDYCLYEDRTPEYLLIERRDEEIRSQLREQITRAATALCSPMQRRAVVAALDGADGSRAAELAGCTRNTFFVHICAARRRLAADPHLRAAMAGLRAA